MKNRIIVSVLYIVLGILLVLAPTKLFPVCSVGEMKMACFYTKQAEVSLGIVITLLGIVSLFIQETNIRIGISVSQLGIASLIFLYPTKLIGLCKKSDMLCRIQTFPAICVVGVLLCVVSITNIGYYIYSRRKDRNHENQ